MLSDQNEAFLLAYFCSEKEEDGEQIRFAVSSGVEPKAWAPKQLSSPVLRSAVGERGARDPFLIRDERRGVFVLLATDLRVWPDEDWGRATRFGSRSILVWESSDLVEWDGPRLLGVAPRTAGNAWAPKAFWSDAVDGFVIVFAAALYAADDDRSVAQHQRLLSVITTDFRSTTAPVVYSDPGHDVIDMTFLVDGDDWYRFSANTHGDAADIGAHIFMERGSGLFADDWSAVVVDIGKATMTVAEGPAVARALDGSRRWYLLIDDIHDSGYHLLETDDLASGDWRQADGAGLPEGARHGSLLPITGAERDRVRARLEHLENDR